jgi:hypothetical protein
MFQKNNARKLKKEKLSKQASFKKLDSGSIDFHTGRYCERSKKNKQGSNE